MATPTYAELASMANSSSFSDRCAIALTGFARYILNENPATQNHQRRYGWAIGAIQNPISSFTSIKYAIAIDQIFASQNPLDMAATPDSGAGSIQAAVEATINSTVLAF